MFGRPILYNTTTQRGWCTEAFVPIPAHIILQYSNYYYKSAGQDRIGWDRIIEYIKVYQSISLSHYSATYVCMQVCMYVYIYIYIYLYLSIYLSIYLYMYMYIYIYMCIYIYIYIYISGACSAARPGQVSQPLQELLGLGAYSVAYTVSFQNLMFVFAAQTLAI